MILQRVVTVGYVVTPADGVPFFTTAWEHAVECVAAQRWRIIEVIGREEAERVAGEELRGLEDRAIRAETLLGITTETLNVARALVAELEARR